MDLTVHRGEIVGVAGVEGNGQDELAEVLAGVRRATAGQIFIGGKEMDLSDPAGFISSGVGYIPSDRNTVGTVPDFPLYETWMLRNPHYPKKRGLTALRAVPAQAAQALSLIHISMCIRDRAAAMR